MQISFQKVNTSKHKMKHPSSPSSKAVLDSVKDLPTNGTVAQDDENGMVYLNLDDDWIFHSLKVLRDSGFIRPPFFSYPPFPVGAHIKIVTQREAGDYELFGEKKEKVREFLGKTVDFEVVKAHVSYPRIKKYGVEAKYKIRVKSSELSKIRKELTGLSTGPNDRHFVILVGLRNPELNEEMNEEEFEKKLSTEEKHSMETSDDDEKTKTEVSEDEMKPASSSKSEPKSENKKSSSIKIQPANIITDVKKEIAEEEALVETSKKKRITRKMSETPTKKRLARKRTPTPAPTKKIESSSISEEEPKVPEVKKEEEKIKVPEVKKEEEEIKVPEVKRKVETKISGQAQKITGKRSKSPTKKSITRKRTPTPAPSKKRIARKRSKTPTKKGEVQGEVKEEI